MTLPALNNLRRLAALCLLAAGAAQAGTGLTVLPAAAGHGPVTVFYPTDAPGRRLDFGPGVSATLATDAPVQPGNGRLVMLSHGSGGGPFVYLELIGELVGAGFVVAAPEHRGDNRNDPGEPGPASWDRRPAEVSRGIDAVLADPRFAPLLAGDRVGLYGMSAGGHTALSLAGGRWSPSRMRDHCEAHLVEDPAFCTGLNVRFTGGSFDGLKQWAVRHVMRWRFGDTRLRADHDPRIAAIAAAVPVAADFDLDSLRQPRVPLALLTAGQDRWLVPRFHAERVLAACTGCERLGQVAAGGHGAYLGPLPGAYRGILAEMLNDPPGFDRADMAAINRRVAAWFVQRLGVPAAPLAVASTR